MRGLSTATTGSTTGISASVASAAGTAGVFNNTAGGKILSGQNNGVQKFAVDGNGNVNIAGGFTGSGAGLTGIQFSSLSGTLASSQLSGTYSNAVRLSSTSNVFYGDGSHLTGTGGGGGGGTFVNTNYPVVNLPTQVGQQVELGALQLPAGVLNALNLSFDVWAAITMNAQTYGAPPFFQANLYLCDTPTCSGQLNAALGPAPEVDFGSPAYGIRASYVMTTAGTTASAVGSEEFQGGDSGNILTNQQSQQFDSTQALYFVVTIYMDGIPLPPLTAQMNVLRLSIVH